MTAIPAPPPILGDVATLTPRETLVQLYHLAAAVPADEAIVEIGTYRGASACWLASGAAAGLGAHVWTIDPHDLPGDRTTTGRGSGGLDFTRPAIREHAEQQVAACGLSESVSMIRGFSIDVADRWDGPQVGMLFVDGDHREEAAEGDLLAWHPHMAPDAVVAWDDYADSHPGVPAAVAGLARLGIITPPDVRGRLAITGLVPPVERALDGEGYT